MTDRGHQVCVIYPFLFLSSHELFIPVSLRAGTVNLNVLPCVDSAQMQNTFALFWLALLDHAPSGPYDLCQMKVLELRGPSAHAYLPGALQKKLCPQILRRLL